MFLLVACGGGMTRTTTGDAPGETLPTAGPGPAEVTFVDPAAGGFVAVGTQGIVGIGRHMTTVTVNGVPALLSRGMFLVDVATEPGLNTFVATGTDEAGVTYTDMAAVVAGSFAKPTGVVKDAVQLHLSADALANLGPAVGSLVDPALLDAEVQAMNPVMDTPDAEINLGSLSFGAPDIVVVPRGGALDLTIRLPDFRLPVDATIKDALPFGIDLDLGVDLECDELLLHTTVALDTDGRGGLKVRFGALDAELSSFDLDTGILELIDWLFLDDDDLAVFVEDALAALGPELDAMAADLLGELDLTVETELLEQTVTLAPSFDTVTIDPSGIGLSVGVAIDVDGADRPVPGHLHLPPPPATAGGEVRVQIADDFVNRALFELWAGGALDLELPLGTEEAAILMLFGGSGTGSLSMESALPPVWIEKDGVNRLQMGELGLAVETPGGVYGERVELVLSLDAKADLEVTAASAGVVLTDGRVRMRLAGDSIGNAALAEKLPQLEAAFGIGIGFVNDLLVFPLTDVLPAGTVLPPIALTRDPSALGSVIELEVEDLAPLLALLTAEPAVP